MRPVDSDTNEFPHVKLYSLRTTVVTKQFLVDGVPWIQDPLFEEIRIALKCPQGGNTVNLQVRNHLRHAAHRTTETWCKRSRSRGISQSEQRRLGAITKLPLLWIAALQSRYAEQPRGNH